VHAPWTLARTRHHQIALGRDPAESPMSISVHVVTSSHMSSYMVWVPLRSWVERSATALLSSQGSLLVDSLHEVVDEGVNDSSDGEYAANDGAE